MRIIGRNDKEHGEQQSRHDRTRQAVTECDHVRNERRDKYECGEERDITPMHRCPIDRHGVPLYFFVPNSRDAQARQATKSVERHERHLRDARYIDGHPRGVEPLTREHDRRDQDSATAVVCLRHSTDLISAAASCPLVEVKRTRRGRRSWSRHDPSATSAVHCGNGFDARSESRARMRGKNSASPAHSSIAGEGSVVGLSEGNL